MRRAKVECDRFSSLRAVRGLRRRASATSRHLGACVRHKVPLCSPRRRGLRGRPLGFPRPPPLARRAEGQRRRASRPLLCRDEEVRVRMCPDDAPLPHVLARSSLSFASPAVSARASTRVPPVPATQRPPRPLRPPTSRRRRRLAEAASQIPSRPQVSPSRAGGRHSATTRCPSMKTTRSTTCRS
jgi:hypothetical protein